MASKPLRSQINQIRIWVRQGRTDAWIAHQLEVSADEIASFKKDHQLEIDAGTADDSGTGTTPSLEDDVDLRAEDDALIAAELEAALAARAAQEEADKAAAANGAQSDNGSSGARRRGRRGGRGRRRGPVFEATFDHGEEGYGLWLDPSVADDSVYAEHWAGHRPIAVSVGPDQIVITRAGAAAGNDDDDADDSDA